MNTELCLNCPNTMLGEGFVDDDIQLCHACYSNETLIEYGYLEGK